jgi:hypothetical protein
MGKNSTIRLRNFVISLGLVCAFTFLGTGTGLALPQPGAQVRVQLASLIPSRDASGQEQLQPSQAIPGQPLVWQATAINDLATPVQDLILTVPVPLHTTYINGSARLSVLGQMLTPQFSWDNRTFGPAPLKRQVSQTQNGVTRLVEVVVPPTEYRAVRWIIPRLPAKTRVTAEVRTSVQ